MESTALAKAKEAVRPLTIAFLSSGAKEADEALERLTRLYGDAPLGEADVIVALGATA